MNADQQWERDVQDLIHDAALSRAEAEQALRAEREAIIAGRLAGALCDDGGAS